MNQNEAGVEMAEGLRALCGQLRRNGLYNLDCFIRAGIAGVGGALVLRVPPASGPNHGDGVPEASYIPPSFSIEATSVGVI